MKLIGSNISPFVRKIAVILLEKNISFESVIESPWTNESHIPQYNPLGKIPVLVTGPEEIWYDSHIIAAWLEQQYGTPALLPSEKLAALKVLQLQALADGVGDAAVLLLREQMRPAETQLEEQLLRQRGKIGRGLDALEKEADSGLLLNTDAINLADIATACVIGYMNFRHISPGWHVGRPALVRLMEKMFARESFARTAPAQA
ncbi:glutathione S-transferase [Erwinia psidii]|uniref:Glutathione S-transferase n=1 Tax=Erwinia psidii TaxID=69224 RepID=A0A3N6S063_9GAMM|nr:glutathione S-transferase [Erwinia psidii]MCX8958413.1 glutathione S-transferase [Erwinia psidii]MCX8965495.1 glutathione S-transferase [Erwinia psidii]RQM38874.1 glutathione S-transferase [Erwinia psidii]